MKLAGVVIAILVLAGAGYFLLTDNRLPQDFESAKQNGADLFTQSSEQQVEQKTDIKAAFAIFTNGTFRIFTDPMYHNLSKDIYIERSNPNIIKIQKSDMTWDDFFMTLPLKLDHECLTTGTGETFCTGEAGTLKFYINGEDSTEDALPKVINNGDKLLVSFGDETPNQIKSQIDKIPNP